MEEIWKDIDGFNGQYQISNTGLIRSTFVYNHLFKKIVYRNKILKCSEYKYPYQCVILNTKPSTTVLDIEKLVATYFIPIPQEFLSKGYTAEILKVKHLDNNVANNLVTNLQWELPDKEKDPFDLPGEKWVDIIGYEGLYKISNLGRIKNITKDKILISSFDSYGYKVITLYKNSLPKMYKLHRLLAIHFIPVPQELLDQGYTIETLHINHKDENPSNFNIDNLEWCTAKYNRNYGNATIKIIEKKSKPITQFDLDGNWMRNWKHTTEIINTLSYVKSTMCITECCNGHHHTAYGYIWRYTLPEYGPGYQLDMTNIQTTRTSGKKISQFDDRGNFIRTWNSTLEVEANISDTNSTNISYACNHCMSSAANSIWKFWNPKHKPGYIIYQKDLYERPIRLLEPSFNITICEYPNLISVYNLIMYPHIAYWMHILKNCYGFTALAYHYRWEFIDTPIYSKQYCDDFNQLFKQSDYEDKDLFFYPFN